MCCFNPLDKSVVLSDFLRIRMEFVVKQREETEEKAVTTYNQKSYYK